MKKYGLQDLACSYAVELHADTVQPATPIGTGNHAHRYTYPRCALFGKKKMVNEVLSLYRAILRLGRQQLKLTDKDYFRKLVRDEFKKNREERCPDELKFQVEVSKTQSESA